MEVAPESNRCDRIVVVLSIGNSREKTRAGVGEQLPFPDPRGRRFPLPIGAIAPSASATLVGLEPAFVNQENALCCTCPTIQCSYWSIFRPA